MFREGNIALFLGVNQTQSHIQLAWGGNKQCLRKLKSDLKHHKNYSHERDALY